MTFTDTHCHIHEESFADAEGAYQRALEAGVTRMIVVGTDIKSSDEAIQFASTHSNAWAIVGIHPHEAKKENSRIDELREMMSSSHRLVGIGEIGLDYYYAHSPREIQIETLECQIDLALKYHLPISFHVRDGLSSEGSTSVWNDFWPIFDNFKGLRGVLHSYTDNLSNMEKALTRGLYTGVNGIATFAKDKQTLYQVIPPTKILLETDSPYLTPHPHRGTINEPALLKHVAKHIANLQSINLQELSRATEASATTLFNLK